MVLPDFYDWRPNLMMCSLQGFLLIHLYQSMFPLMILFWWWQREQVWVLLFLTEQFSILRSRSIFWKKLLLNGRNHCIVCPYWLSWIVWSGRRIQWILNCSHLKFRMLSLLSAIRQWWIIFMNIHKRWLLYRIDLCILMGFFPSWRLLIRIGILSI